MSNKKWLPALLLIVIAVLGIAAVVRSIPEVSDNSIERSAGQSLAQIEAEVPEQISTVELLFAGDNLIHKSIYNQAKARTGDGSYDFLPDYVNVREKIAAADIAVLNQETMMVASKEVSTYPTFNSPPVLAKQMAEIGFDVLSIANNHMLDKWSDGLIETLDLINSTDGLVAVGAYHERSEYTEKIPVVTSNGIKFAFLSYTEHTNGLSLPDDREDYIIYLDEADDVKLQVEQANKIADVVVVMMHAGTEYADDENEIQSNFAQNVADWGADMVIGTHPHTLQPIKYVTSQDGRSVPVVYSLGNFISAQDKQRRMIGGIANFTVSKSNKSDEVTISAPSIDIVVTHYGSRFSNIRLYLLKDYTNTLALSHGVGGNFTRDYIVEHAKKIIGEEYLSKEQLKQQ